MASYPLNFPTKAPATQRLILSNRQSPMESPFNLQMKVVNTASQWLLEWTWPQMVHTDAELVHAWLNSLRGMVGTFKYVPYKSFQTSLTGKTLNLAGYAYGNTISLAGWAAGAASLVRVGQYFQIGDQLLQVVSAQAVADASGHVTVDYEPSLRKTYVPGTAVEFANPCGIFRLSTSDGYGYTLNYDRKPDMGTISAREVIS